MKSGCTKNVVESSCPQLLDLIPQEEKWHLKREDGSSEEKKLELRLGPPGDHHQEDDSLLSLGYDYGKQAHNKKLPCPEDHHHHPVGSVLSTTPWSKNHHQHHHHHSFPVIAKESSQTCCNNKAVDLQNDTERKIAFKPPPANTAVPLNTSQKRTAPGPVVGWPPIRSIRKNLASNNTTTTSSKQSVDPNKVANEKPVAAAEPNSKGLFVKINMDGVPIGRKVDLKAYDSYEKLSNAVDELFRGLLAAQRDSCAGGIVNTKGDEKAITGILDGSGEYTLVYEDNEGDSMLVGDVPWHMFVSTVKRLRALKSSELSALNLGSSKQGKLEA